MRRVVRRSPRREQPAAGRRSGDRFRRLPNHGAHQQKRLPRDRRGEAREERVSVSRGTFAVGMAMQNHIQAVDAVVVRPSATLMVVRGKVEGHRPANCRRRHNREQGACGQAAPQRTQHARQYPRCAAARQSEAIANVARPAALTLASAEAKNVALRGHGFDRRQLHQIQQ